MGMAVRTTSPVAGFAGATVLVLATSGLPLPPVVLLIPRFLVGGVLVFVGLAFLVEWVIDVRRSLPLGEYAIVRAREKGAAPNWAAP